MHKTLATITHCIAALASVALAEVAPVWSTGVAVPGEQVMLYLIDTEIGEDAFTLKERPRATQASLKVQQPTLGTNPLDPNRAMVEILPILVQADKAGELQVENLVVEYRSGRKVQVKAPPLPVRSTAEIKWYTTPVPYGALWYTSTKDGYVHQPIKVALKIFMQQDCNTGNMPQMNSVGVKTGTMQPAVQGVAAMVQSRLMQDTTAFARGQTWRTSDFTGEFIPFREGNSEITGKVLMVKQRGIFTVGQEEVPVPELNISALPLPPGAPPAFADLVGSYSISTRTDASALAMNEAVDVEITVRGAGNLQQLACPSPDDAKDWKLVPATRKPIIAPNGETVGMVFSQLMRPVTEVGGVPSFSLTYFDPKAMEYKRAIAPPIPLPWHETETAGAALVQAATPPPAGSVPVEEMTDIYGYISRDETFAPLLYALPLCTWYLLYLPALAIFGYMGVRALLRRLAMRAGNRARERELAAISREQEGLAFLKKIGAFIESHIPTQAMTPELESILTRRNDEAFRPDAAPDVTEQQRAAMLRSVRKVLSALAGKAMLLALLLLPLAGAAESSPEQLYNGRQYTKALETLTHRARSFPVDDPVVLYNIGNCQYRLGQPGLAAYYYAAALQIDPQFAEARANLAFIQRKEGAILPIRSTADSVFTFFTCSQLWMATIICTAVLALCIALLILRRRTSSKPWLTSCTALSAVLSLLCGVNWVYYCTRETPDISSLPPQDVAYVIKSVTARTAADDEASGVLRLPPSTPVHLLAQRGSRCYIETVTGVRGWVTSDALKPLSNAASPRVPVSILFYR